MSYIREHRYENGKTLQLYELDRIHFVARRVNCTDDNERTVDNVRAHLQAALGAIQGLHGAGPVSAERAKALHEAVEDLAFLLPDVEAWCVVEQRSGWDRNVYFGCLTEVHATELLQAARAYEDRRAKEHPHWSDHEKRTSERLVVVKTRCRVLDLIAPGVTAETWLSTRLSTRL